MSAKKILLKSTTGDELYPRASLDNLVATAGSTVTVQVPTLVDGKIDTSYLPSYVDDTEELLTIAETAPATCAKDDKYYNSSSNKIFKATATNTWGTTGEDPMKDKIYVNLANDNIYRWSGTDLIEISKQVSTVTTVRASGSALDTVVPTEKAVRTELDKKQDNLTQGTNVTISNSTVSVANASTSAKGAIQIATGTEVTTGTDSSKAVVPSTLKTELDKKQNTLTQGTNVTISNSTVSVANASTSAKGAIQIATSTEVTTGTDSSKAVVPSTLKTELDKKQNTLTAGTNIDITSGTVTNTYTLPTAATDTLGGVKIGSNISIGTGTNAGKISVADGSTSAKGVIQLATVSEATTGTSEAKAVTPKGLKTELDKKQNTLTAGTNIDLTGGTVTNTYELPAATSSTLGGVIVSTTASNGISLGISSGTISVSATQASTSAYGTVKVSTTASNGVALAVSSGTISISTTLASDSAFGTVKISTTASNGVSLAISNGVVSASASVASTSAFGTVKVSTTASNGVALAISSGTISVSTTAASTSAKGTVQLATTTEASTGIEDTKAVTPAGVKAALSGFVTYEELT